MWGLVAALIVLLALLKVRRDKPAARYVPSESMLLQRQKTVSPAKLADIIATPDSPAALRAFLVSMMRQMSL